MKDMNMNGNVSELSRIIDFTNFVIKLVEENDAKTFSKDLVLQLLNEIKKNELLRIERI
jgi:hypothetical protein